MANYFVSSTGSNTSPYDTWAKAATTLASALALATSSGDVVAVDTANPPADISADTAWTLSSWITLTGSTNSGTSDITPSIMGDATYLGSTGAFTVTVNGAVGGAYVYGLTFRNGGAANDAITIGNSANSAITWENCYFWLGTTSSTPDMVLGATSTSGGAINRFINCSFRFGNTGQALDCASSAIFEGGSIVSAGSAPATLFECGANCGFIDCVGVDLSHVTGTLCSGITDDQATRVHFDRCVLGSGVSVMGTTNLSSERNVSVLVTDCHSGDTHGIFGFYNPLGSVVSDTGIYFTSGAAAQSWKIVTTADANFKKPFRTPPISLYNTGTSAITPYLEILRDGSTTAYDNDEVWAEGFVKSSSGFTNATKFSDAMAFLGTPAAQANGAGLGSWTGENATAWSGKIDSGSAVTPAEAGELSMSICVGLASATVYIDPQIRT